MTHEEFNWRNKTNDIAIIKLNMSVSFNGQYFNINKTILLIKNTKLDYELLNVIPFLNIEIVSLSYLQFIYKLLIKLENTSSTLEYNYRSCDVILVEGGQ